MLDLSLLWPSLQNYFAVHDPWMVPLVVLLVLLTPLLQAVLKNANMRRNDALYGDAIAERDAALRALDAERAAHAATRSAMDQVSARRSPDSDAPSPKTEA